MTAEERDVMVQAMISGMEQGYSSMTSFRPDKNLPEIYKGDSVLTMAWRSGWMVGSAKAIQEDGGRHETKKVLSISGGSL